MPTVKQRFIPGKFKRILLSKNFDEFSKKEQKFYKYSIIRKNWGKNVAAKAIQIGRISQSERSSVGLFSSFLIFSLTLHVSVEAFNRSKMSKKGFLFVTVS